MKLTVERILNYRVMEKARVLTCRDKAVEQTVQWISAIEMPVENFVRKDEVILTTALGCQHDPEVLRTFVQEIIDSEAAALMIAVGRHIFDIPAEVIKQAEEQQFLIIEIPWEVRFSAIIEEVMKDLNGIQDHEREKTEKVQQELLQLIMTNADLLRITRFIDSLTGSAVMVTDRTGAILEKSGFTRQFTDRWQQLTAEGGFPLQQEARAANRDPLLQRFQLVAIEDEHLLQVPVLQVAGEVQGYLYIMLPKDASVASFLTRYRIQVLEHAATAVALWFSREQAIEETKISLRSDFVQELAKGEFNSAAQANTRAELLGYDLSLPYICMLAKPENLQELLQQRKQETAVFTYWNRNMVRYLEEEIYYAARHLKRNVMMTYAEDRLLIFLEVSPGTESENAVNFLDFIDRRLKHLLPEVIISWGIGNRHPGLAGFAASYDDAEAALLIGSRKKGRGQRTHYEETRIDRILLKLAQSSDMQEVILSAIEPIVRYDQQRNMDLIGTFTTYNQYNGNVSQTARMLNLHRQSLLYRLRKIEALTDLSLIDPDDLFLLDLSIRTWKAGLNVSNPDINSR
ncbi:PucR family transcriptional regulator [Planococcus lenghuensis]|uniref:PucR family transcriptional regulator n=1 Tax=Planococcus lenghuensis TaxID=2213202 RepID=A0A1Q2KXK8_9BACL|nr:PucR family transcriptional regulator [Planococcus lenghuensis]AQQ52402.1 PucR family transcriptional regulator [Planococcus lenghuensis]